VWYCFSSLSLRECSSTLREILPTHFKPQKLKRGPLSFVPQGEQKAVPTRNRGRTEGLEGLLYSCGSLPLEGRANDLHNGRKGRRRKAAATSRTRFGRQGGRSEEGFLASLGMTV
jgi:hypothetical protein